MVVVIYIAIILLLLILNFLYGLMLEKVAGRGG